MLVLFVSIGLSDIQIIPTRSVLYIYAHAYVPARFISAHARGHMAKNGRREDHERLYDRFVAGVVGNCPSRFAQLLLELSAHTLPPALSL